jgi:hypothetical protein
VIITLTPELAVLVQASHAEKIGASGIGVLPNCFERPKTVDDLGSISQNSILDINFPNLSLS